jgi:hypothetical protein
VGGTLLVDGAISANGSSGNHQDCGAGSGGGINITCRRINGAGTIRANGGAAGGFSGAGGGGRIAILRSTHNFTGSAEALKGTGSSQVGLEDGTVVWLAPLGGTIVLVR